ncbi:MAG TPA: lysophospholipid acyltransferase family protein [Candidatus Acidoferrales bacterium]|jgi:1-acyl-sn-glycerol-3-phosphate acyltransferase|nr:lysophospholipid acyltransferase family protein [Candidatus Acidoferrales bacterium]
MTFRAAWKLCWFLLEVGVVAVDYFFTTAFVSKAKKRRARSAWLQRAARRHIKIYSCDYSSTGPIPKSGLLVSNHLSYLDIMVIASITPVVFVSKSEVRNWPVIGWLTALAGTIFIVRERRTHVGAVNQEIESALADGVLVVVFPEGTSTNGSEVLPFRSPLLEPVTHGNHPISVGFLHYELDDGDPANEVCYWGDHTFFPHAVNLLSKKRVRAKMTFGTYQRTTDDRKELAKDLHEAVLKLKLAD